MAKFPRDAPKQRVVKALERPSDIVEKTGKTPNWPAPPPRQCGRMALAADGPPQLGQPAPLRNGANGEAQGARGDRPAVTKRCKR
jgi:hypothetical protein